jgi:hypothetical protein
MSRGKKHNITKSPQGITVAVALLIDNLTISLQQKSKVLALAKHGYNRNLDTVLIKTLDNLLKKTNIDISSVTSFQIESDLDSNNTSLKITKAFLEGLVVRHI